MHEGGKEECKHAILDKHTFPPPPLFILSFMLVVKTVTWEEAKSVVNFKISLVPLTYSLKFYLITMIC